MPADFEGIDITSLVRNVQALATLNHHPEYWDELGQAFASNANDCGRIVSWDEVERSVHAAIRERMERCNGNHMRLLGVLELWPAGEFRVSVKGTRSMAAVILFAIARAEGDFQVLAATNGKD